MKFSAFASNEVLGHFQYFWKQLDALEALRGTQVTTHAWQEQERKIVASCKTLVAAMRDELAGQRLRVVRWHKIKTPVRKVRQLWDYLAVRL